MRKRVLWTIPILLSCLWLTREAAGHELGALQVRATVEPGELHLDLVVDVEHLPPGVLPDTVDQALDERLRTLRLRLSEAAEVRFDGIRAEMTASPAEITSEDDAPKLAFRLDGDVPAGAEVLTWSLDLPVGTYVFSADTGHEDSATAQWLDGGRAVATVALGRTLQPPSRQAVLGRYLVLGFTHILPHGLDHILFVLGLFLLSFKLRPLMTQITAFTVAHSITLGLSIYGLVSLPARVVEPLIALSIAYVAFENLFTTELKPWRPALVFAFGLLHGLGFAGVLHELGLPRSEFLTALVSFNLGVEAGQLAVVGLAFLLIGKWWAEKAWYRQRVVVTASLLISAVGLYWTVERLWGM